MKRFSYRRHYHRQIIRDTFILVTPPLLTLIGILWLFREDWLPRKVVLMLMSFSSRLHDLWTIGT